MGTGKLKIIRALPGPTTIGPILESFERGGDGIVTSLNDGFLPSARRLLLEGSPIEVKPFGEVVRMVHLFTGRETRRVAAGGQQLAAVAEACRELPTESPFAEVAQFPGFHPAVQKTLKELHAFGLWSEKLRELAGLVPDPIFALKLRSLAEIDERMLEILTKVGTTTLTQLVVGSMDEVLDVDGQQSRLLVFVQSQLAPLSFNWLKWLSSQGTEVTVIVDRHPRNGLVFEAVPKIMSLLDGEVSDIGVGNRLLESLFSDEEPVGPMPKRGVQIQCAADPLAECEWALRFINKRLSQPESEDEEVVIVARNAEAYGPLVDAVAKRFGMKISSRRRVPLHSNGFARFCLSALEALASDDIRLIGKLFEHSYLQLSKEYVRELKSLIDPAFRSADPWITLKCGVELMQSLDDTETSQILSLVEWRVTNVGSEKSPSDWYREFRAFVDGSLWFKNASTSSPEMVDRDQRAYTAMCGSLAQSAAVATVVSPTTVSFAQFVRLAKRVWEDADVSLPSTASNITLVNGSDEVDGADLVVVLGLLEGVFPRRRTEDPILSDFERELISDRLLLEPGLLTSFNAARAERDIFYRVCSLAKNELVFSYPLTDSERDNVRAFYLQEIQRIAGIDHEVRHPRNQLVPAGQDLLLAADVSLSNALNDEKEPAMPNDIATEPARQVLQRKVNAEGDRFSPSSLKRVSQCGFHYFARDVLGLKPKQKYDKYALLAQVPVRASLLTTASRAEARDRLDAEVDQMLETNWVEMDPWERQLLRTVSERMIDEWLNREFNSREFWERDASQTQLNPSFGQGFLKQEKYGVLIDGSVHAITEEGRYRTIHLFKSSAPEKLAKNDADQERELLTYGLMFAAMSGQGKKLRIEVDGMNGKRTLIYFGRDDDERAIRKPLSDLYVVDVLEAYGSDGANEFVQRLKKVIGRAVERVRTGDLRPTPGEHCAYCSFGDLCRRSQDFSEVADPIDQLFKELQDGSEL